MVNETTMTKQPLPAGEPWRRAADRRELKRIRFEFNAVVQLNSQKLPVAGLDAHRAGARVTSSHPLPLGTLVLFQIDASGFAAYAAVRCCEKAGRGGYEIGIEYLVPRAASAVAAADS
jgi:hypothetical protein